MKKIFLSLIFLSSVMLVQTDLSACKGWQKDCDLFNPCCGPLDCGFFSMGGSCACPGGQHHTTGDNCASNF
jgi:hypothetical protein